MKTKTFSSSKRLFWAALAALAISAFLFVSLAAAQTTQKTPQNRSWPHENSDLSPSSNLIFGALDNGFRYIMMKNAKPEDRVSMHLAVDAGSFQETENQRGVAHFLEHMLFNGTSNFPPGELIKYFQRIGMEFGPDVNGSTGFYQTVYDLDLPGGDKKMLSEAMLVMHDFAAEALLEQKDVIQERKVILAEKRTRDTPGYRTFKKTFKFELPHARVSKRLPIGIESVIKNTDRKLLKTFYDTWYRPERLILVVVGDFTPDTAEKLIRQQFSDLKPRAPQKPAPNFGQVNHKGIEPFYHHEPESGGTRVAIEAITKQPLKADTSEYQRSRLAADMANQIVNHRLEAMLNKPDTPFTDASISSGRYLKFVKSAEINADCAPKNWEQAFSAIEQSLRKALEHGFTASEVKRVQKEYTSRLKQEVKGASTRQSSHIAGQIIHHLNSELVFQSPRQRLDLLQPAIDATTPSSLHQEFKKQWAPGQRLLLVTGNADLTENSTPPEDRIKAVYMQSRKKQVKKPKNKEDVKFPYLAAPHEAGEIKNREKIEDLGVTRVVFENGVTLLVKKTDFKANQVLAAASFGYGESAEPSSKPALAEMSEKVINLSGLGQLNREELKQALAGKSTEVSFEVEEDKFVLSASSVPEETRLLFELLYAHLLDPGLRKQAHRLALDQFKQHYEYLSHSVQGAMPLKGSRFLAGGDPRFGLPPFEAVEKTGLPDIRKWIKPAFDNASVEVAVVGDINTDNIIREASVFFGSLPERTGNKEPENLQNPDFPEGKTTSISVPTKISKGLVVAAYPTTDIWNIEKTRRLSILSRIFSDRMRIRIREEMGASYSQTAYNKQSRVYSNYGVFAGYTVIDPDDAEAVEKAIKTIAENLSQNGATSDELKRALEPTLTGIKEQLKTNDYWINTVLKGAARHPVQLEWSRTLLKDYKSINVKDVNRMAETYLENPKAAVIRVRPASRNPVDQNRNQ
ncbi:MAG: insulinase family protein [Desulfobacteraceae bacterium]|nr:insulinase family protein [Desulfobacteraceae bacterium]